MRYSNFTLKPAIVSTSACGSAWPKNQTQHISPLYHFRKRKASPRLVRSLLEKRNREVVNNNEGIGRQLVARVERSVIAGQYDHAAAVVFHHVSDGPKPRY